MHGFRYFDQRAMIGFVDGTENPEGHEAFDYTVIGDEDAAFSGGSYVLVQKYLHDMQGWNSLSVETQEKIIGRHKQSNIELDEAVKPSSSHSSLTTITDEQGNEVKILRDNMPFGRPGLREFGTYFIGYARSRSRSSRCWKTCLSAARPATDRLLDFSHAVTGTLFFVPSAPLLEALADRSGAELH